MTLKTPPVTYRQKNNWIGSSYVDTNMLKRSWRSEWQTIIGEVTDQINWRIPVFSFPEASCQLFLDKTRQRNNLYGKKPPPQQYQRKFSNLSLFEEVSDFIEQIL